MKHVVIVEFNNFHQETVFAWVYVLVTKLQYRVTVFSPDRCGSVDYCNRMLSTADKERLEWRAETTMMEIESLPVLKKADCFIFNTFCTSMHIFETHQKPMLQFCSKENKQVIMYVHRPERLFDSPMATYLCEESDLRPQLLFSCKHGIDWYEKRIEQNSSGQNSSEHTLIKSLHRDWFFPAHVSPSRCTSPDQITMNRQTDARYHSAFAIVGGLATNRRNYFQAYTIAQQTQGVTNSDSPTRLLAAGRELGRTNVIRKKLRMRRYQSNDSLGMCRIVTDPSYDTMFDIVAQSKVVLTCCTGEHYATNTLSGSVLMAVAAGVPFSCSERVHEAYARAFNEFFFFDERNMQNVTDDDVMNAQVEMNRIRTEMIDRNAAFFQAYLTKKNE